MKSKFVVTHYYMKEELQKIHQKAPALKIAFISDVHEQNPSILLKKLKSQQADLILIAGDTLERRDEEHGYTMEEIDAYQIISPNWSRFCRCMKYFHKVLAFFHIKTKSDAHYGHYFLKEVSKIAPVYLSLGNHEWYFLEEDEKLMKNCGIHILDNEDCMVKIKGRSLRIGGLSTRHNLEWLHSFAKKDGYKILLCHHPEYYSRFILNDGDPFDLVLSGHVHGGQWRFFGRGIMAPGQGILPIFHHGRYGKLIVNAGASNPSFIPRFGNPTELVILHL